MKKKLIYLNKIREDWIIDRVRKEWYQYNGNVTTKNYYKADIFWLISPWTWKKYNLEKISKTRKLICSIYHIDEKKMDEKYISDFEDRDKFVESYHVISENTKKQVSKLTNKKITSIPFWVNQNYFYHIKNKDLLRKKYSVDASKFLIGSFQRDTESFDLTKPKLSKGPDRLIEIYKHYKELYGQNLLIILAGKSRNYIMYELEKINVEYLYFEMTDFNTLNELYNLVDLYIVASRFEGGPQAILEASITKTPIISTNVGVAPELLSKTSIFDMNNFREAKPNINIAFDNASKFTIPNGFERFNEFFRAL